MSKNRLIALSRHEVRVALHRIGLSAQKEVGDPRDELVQGGTKLGHIHSAGITEPDPWLMVQDSQLLQARTSTIKNSLSVRSGQSISKLETKSNLNILEITDSQTHGSIIDCMMQF